MPQSAREKEGVFKGADALAVVTGSANEDELYSKSASLQNWLLGYEFPDTCIVIGNRSLTVLTSAKKGAPPPRPAGSHFQLFPAHAPLVPRPLACSLAFFVHRRSAGPLCLPTRRLSHSLRSMPSVRVTPAPPGARAVQYLQPLVEAENATLPLELIASEKKSPDKNKSKYAQLVSAIKSSHSGVIVGCLLKASSALRRRRPGCERLGAGLGPLPFSVARSA